MATIHSSLGVHSTGRDLWPGVMPHCVANSFGTWLEIGLLPNMGPHGSRASFSL